MEAPRLSVIIPVYNGEDTLGDQLRALRDQPSSFAWEVLVCDNGSTDGTVDLVRRWQADWPELRTIDASARRGPSFARNSGARAASAPFLAFCDADDVVGDGWVVSMHTALTAHPFVAGSLDGDRLNAGHKASLSWSTDGSFTKPFLPWLTGAPSGNMGIRKNVFDQVGGFEEALPTNEDTDLSWRVQLAGYELSYHPEIVLHVRRRDGLSPVFRQAYSYGAGDKQLRRRYAQVIDAYQTVPGQGAPAQTEPAPRGTTGLLSRALNKARRVRRPADLADQVWRVGYWLGERRGAKELSAPPVVAPSQLRSDGETRVAETLQVHHPRRVVSTKSQLLVRRRDIEQQPPPPGGHFRKVALTRLGLPAVFLHGFGVFCVDTTDKVVAITYDDGPHAEHTPRILDLLSARQATATFFVLGRQVEKYPEIARRIVADGHEIGLHGYDHRSLVTMEHRASIANLREAKDRVESVVSTQIDLFRPPYGAHTTRQARAIRRLGMDVVIWSGDAVDWAHDEEHNIAGRALDAAFSGGILLMHDDRGDPETLQPGEAFPSFDRALVLEQVLDGLAEAGCRTVQAGQLLRRYPHVRSLARERATPA